MKKIFTNSALGLLLAIIIGYNINNYYSGGMIDLGNSSKLPMSTGATTGHVDDRDFDIAQMKKDPFYPLKTEIVTPKVQKTVKAGEGASQPVNDNRYQLEGIFWGKKDPAAMLKDSQTNETIMVKQGQVIGSFVVRNISKESVTLSQGVKKIVLSTRNEELLK
ncbi:MAG: hypothetical protein A2293_12355 [Elusimicrobia bacterium RIFOXYB2_FULL_49_7]|nr:MAG: hypothetical protein A2293_12355 [Elusimicrobia bacterium RIFOXYB2_FULL_49_7]